MFPKMRQIEGGKQINRRFCRQYGVKTYVDCIQMSSRNARDIRIKEPTIQDLHTSIRAHRLDRHGGRWPIVQ